MSYIYVAPARINVSPNSENTQCKRLKLTPPEPWPRTLDVPNTIDLVSSGEGLVSVLQ